MLYSFQLQHYNTKLDIPPPPRSIIAPLEDTEELAREMKKKPRYKGRTGA